MLRYQDRTESYGQSTGPELTSSQVVRQIFNLNFIKYPNSLSSNITKVAIVVFSKKLKKKLFCGLDLQIFFSGILSTALCCLTVVGNYEHIFTIILTIVIAAGLLLMILIIYRQPVDNIELSFKVPCVPILPCLSILINLYLMFQLDVNTWIRFGVWVLIGKKVFLKT